MFQSINLLCCKIGSKILSFASSSIICMNMLLVRGDRYSWNNLSVYRDL